MNNYQKEKEEKDGVLKAGMLDISIMGACFMFVFVVILSIAMSKSAEKNILAKTDLIKEESQYIFKKLSNSEEKQFTCYTNVEVSEPELMGFFERMTTHNPRMTYNLHLTTDRDFTKDCFKQYVSFHQEWSYFKRFEDKAIFNVYIRDKDGRIFTYEDYQKVQLHSEDDYLAHRTFVK